MRRHPVLATVIALSAGIALGGAVAAADTTDGYCLIYRAPADTSEVTLEAAANMLDDRLGSMGIAGDAIADPGAGTICVEIRRGPADLDAARDLAAGLGSKGELRFVPVPDSCFGEAIAGAPPPACLDGVPPLFDGTGVAYADVGEDQTMGEPVVNLELDDAAARLFDEYAEEYFGEQFAIVFDGVVVSAPTINATRFGGQAQISGGADGFASTQAEAVAAALLTGALPVELTLDDVRTCAVPADLSVRTPEAVLARAGADLEAPAWRAATFLRDLGVDDFVITLHPETDRITVTVLAADPALARPVESVLPKEWVGDVDLGFIDATLDEFLAGLPDQPVPLRWSDETPDGTEWQPVKGALIGDPSDLGDDEPAGVDVEAVLETYERWEAFDALLSEITEDPRFVGYSGEWEGPLILLFARDSIPERAIEELSGYGVPMLPGSDVTEIRGAEIDLTLRQVQRIRDTLADIVSEHGLDPDELQVTFHLDQKPEAFITVTDPDISASIRKAVRDRLGKGVVRLWILDDDWFEVVGNE